MTNLLDHHLELGRDGSIDTRALPAHGGVYLIADPDDRPILLASGQNLRRLVVNRLAAPPPDRKSKRTNLAQIAGRIHWRESFSRFETALAHWQIARVLNPEGYRREVAFPAAWFLRVDPASRTPQFLPRRELPTDQDRYVGPFATRRDAETWVHLLEDLFDLCRYHQVLEQTPHGQPCAYFEMGKCPAPCDGSIPLEAYRRSVTAAAAFSAGDHQPRLAALRESMQAAAKALSFEKAASLRQTIDSATAATKRPEYQHLTDLSNCCWLICQRGGPPRRTAPNILVKPFFIRRGAVEVGEPVRLADLESSIPSWLACCGPCSPLPPRSPDEQRARCEALWLVSKFLFQQEYAPGLFYRFDRLPTADHLTQALRRRFTPPATVREPTTIRAAPPVTRPKPEPRPL